MFIFYYVYHIISYTIPDNKFHGANMGPTWGRRAQMGPMLAPWTLLTGIIWVIVDSYIQWIISCFVS